MEEMYKRSCALDRQLGPVPAPDANASAADFGSIAGMTPTAVPQAGYELGRVHVDDADAADAIDPVADMQRRLEMMQRRREMAETWQGPTFFEDI